MNLNLKFIIITLIVALIVVPMSFNIFFLWDSGLARGKTTDWFTLYGNIFGGLIGGFFTYLSLLLTFKKEKENKVEEKRPRIDIPYQSVEVLNSNETNSDFSPIVIELNNIGGSIAQNIECTFSLPNYEEVLRALKQNENKLEIDFEEVVVGHGLEKEEYACFYRLVEDGTTKQRVELGGVMKKYYSDFVGSCIPMVLNHEAKVYYEISPNLSRIINHIVKKRDYTYTGFNENELFDFDLELRYSSSEYGSFTDCFRLKWKYVGVTVVSSDVKFRYILKSSKI